MANSVNCSACDELREDAPNFVVNGLGSTEIASLKNDTGLSVSNGNNDCTDLNNMNDCLVGNMASEVAAYDVCEWKPFMEKYIPNEWTVNKGIISAVCGLWTNIHSLWTKVNCIYTNFSKLVNKLASTTAGAAFVKYYRDLGAGDSVPYWDNISNGFERTLDIYMNSHGASSGNQVADRDYVVMISNCTNFRYFGDCNARLTYYSSGDSRSVATIRQHQGQHPSVAIKQGNGSTSDSYFENFSWTNSSAVLIKKGEHIKVNFYVSDVSAGSAQQSTAPSVRLHQFVLVWIPVNVANALNPSDYLNC